MVLLFYCRCQSSYTSYVLETSILLPPPSILFQNISTSPPSSPFTTTLVMAPNAEVEDIITMTSSQSKVHSLKAAVFHTMAYKLSLEINKNKITSKTIIAFLKILYNVAQIKTKKLLSNSTLAFIWLAQKSQFARLHLMLFSF